MAEGSANVPQIHDMSDAGAYAAGIAAAAGALRDGALVAMPTETVYGLAADATNPRAVGEVFLAKGRPRFNPLIVHVASLAAARSVGEISGEAERLAVAFWPGPLSLVVRKRAAAVADLVTAGLDTVAIRVPAHAVALDLLAAFDGPFAAPSANRAGHVSPTSAAHAVADLGRSIAVVLDARPTPIGIESTVVGFAGGRARLLRPGAVPAAGIATVLGYEPAGPADQTGRPSAPGRLASHYAPAAAMRLDVTEVRPGEALLAFGDAMPPGAEDASAVVNLSPSGDLSEAAARFFGALRDLDRKAEVIAVMPIPETGLGEAINDRLRRAAAPRG